MTCCPKCKNGSLLEIQGSLTPGKKVTMGDLREIGTPRRISLIENLSLADVTSSKTNVTSSTTNVTSSKTDDEQIDRLNKGYEKKPGFVNTAQSNYTVGNGQQAGTSIGDDNKYDSGKTMISKTSIPDSGKLGDGNLNKFLQKTKLVDCEVQTEFTVHVVDEPTWQPSVTVTSPAKVATCQTIPAVSQTALRQNLANRKMFRSTKDEKDVHIKCTGTSQLGKSVQAEITTARNWLTQSVTATNTGSQYYVSKGDAGGNDIPDKGLKLGNIPVVNNKGAGDIYCYNPRKAVEQSEEHNLLRKALQRGRTGRADYFADLTSPDRRF